MADTFTQIYIQVVFAVKGRNSLIQPQWEERLYQYITGIVRSKKQKMIAINGMPDHIHFFIGMSPNCCLSDLVREVKKSSNEFVNENDLSKFKFSWQEGYGAFSYSHSQIDSVAKYILNQKGHHKKIKFKEEYLGFLKKFEIRFEERYLFMHGWIKVTSERSYVCRMWLLPFSATPAGSNFTELSCSINLESLRDKGSTLRFFKTIPNTHLQGTSYNKKPCKSIVYKASL